MQTLAFAKINLFLKILSKRKDGYHNILSLFQTINLYDKIYISLLKNDKIIIDSNFKKIKGKKNLCYNVAKLIKKKYNIKTGIKIYIKKNIPLGSGLGGASSDAVSVLLALNKLFKLKLSLKELRKICDFFGKDLVYFLYKGLCIVESTGEKVTKIKNFLTKSLWFVLVYPNKILLTKDVYNKYDKIKNKESININKTKILDLLKKKRFYDLVYNDLEIAAFKIFPQLKFIKDLMMKLGANKVGMSGSGSTLFTFFNSKKEAINFIKKIKFSFKNYKIFLVKNIN